MMNAYRVFNEYFSNNLNKNTSTIDVNDLLKLIVKNKKKSIIIFIRIYNYFYRILYIA